MHQREPSPFQFPVFNAGTRTIVPVVWNDFVVAVGGGINWLIDQFELHSISPTPLLILRHHELTCEINV